MDTLNTEMILFFVSIAGLFLWNRTEARNDNRSLEQKMQNLEQKMHADMSQLEQKLELKMDSVIKVLQDSMRDFHGRLCSLEEKNKK